LSSIVTTTEPCTVLEIKRDISQNANFSYSLPFNFHDHREHHGTFLEMLRIGDVDIVYYIHENNFVAVLYVSLYYRPHAHYHTITNVSYFTFMRFNSKGFLLFKANANSL